MAHRKKTSSGVIAAIAVLILFIVFPKSSWGYIVFLVGGIWACWLLFGSNKQGAAKTVATNSGRTKTPSNPPVPVHPTMAAHPAETVFTPASVVRPARFLPDEHPISIVSPALPAQEPSPAQRPPVTAPVSAPVAPRRFVDDDVPVSVATQEPAARENFAIPQAPANLGPGRWIAQGESVVVAGSLITGGMIYVGKDLKAYSNSTDPCLINPVLPVAAQANLSEREFGYWPSYSQISSTARRAYLSWLAGGRRDAEADIGYVFLFFYGLERRAIIDGQDEEQARRDRPAIAQEIRRLLVIYGERSYSFKRYASELLDWLGVADYSKQLYNEPVPTFPPTFEVPLYIRLALGLTAVDAVPVPGHLALAWARMDPTSYLRTPATRCVEQFDKLFLQRYAEEFKPGLILPRNKTKLKLVYRPASAGFQGVNEIKLTFGDVPDVTVLAAPQKRLKKIVESVSAELDPYSRYLGRNPDAAASLEALLLLPVDLWPPESEKTVNALKTRIGSGMVVMTMQELLDTLQAQAALNKERATTLAKALESIQIGFEPDVLGGAKTPKPEDPIVLFFAPEPDTSQRRTSVYQAATLTLQLASAVASADGDFSVQEMGHLREQVQAWTHLSPAQSTRLLAHLHLLVAAPVSLTSLKKKLEPLDTKSKEAIAAFMATVAQSDGNVTPAEVKMLEKVYKALGLDAKKVFSDVHAVGAGAMPTGGVLSKAKSTGFQLDTAKIATLQQDSERVSALLADIFKDEAPAPPPPASESELEPSDSEAPPSGLFGLDETHSAFARMLLSRPQWSREELLDVASDLDLMLDGALERINEVSFDTHDIPFTEGEDPVDVNPEILEKLEA